MLGVSVYVTDVYARGASNRGALATVVRGCSLWRSLLERPPPAPESRVRDPLKARTSCGGVDPGGCYIYINTQLL